MKQNHNPGNSIDISLNGPEERRHRRLWKLMKCNVLVITSIFFLISLFMLFGKRPEMSAEENRDLAKKPQFSFESYFNGTYTAEYASWFNDAVPMRSTFKGIISDFREHLGIPYEEGVLIGNIPSAETPEEQPETQPEPETQSVPVIEPTVSSGDTDETTPSQTEAPATEAPTEPTEPQEEYVDGETVNDILVLKDRGLMLFGGSHSRGEAYAATLNRYKEQLGEDVNVYSLVAPTSVSFYLPKKFEKLSVSETEHIDHINSFLEDVKSVDAFTALDAHKNEAIYSRTDHHWQALGAFYAAEEFAKTAGVPFAPLTDYETIVKKGYVGTLYGFTNRAELKDNPEDFIYYAPKNTITTTYYDIDMTNEREGSLLLSNLDNLAVSSWYLVFMGGDERITHVETDCHNGRVLCIIKDSYGNALVPCLTSSFEEIWVVDMRFFKPNAISFLKEKGVTDLLFAMNTFSATGTNSEKLQTILNQ